MFYLAQFLHTPVRLTCINLLRAIDIFKIVLKIFKGMYKNSQTYGFKFAQCFLKTRKHCFLVSEKKATQK